MEAEKQNEGTKDLSKCCDSFVNYVVDVFWLPCPFLECILCFVETTGFEILSWPYSYTEILCTCVVECV